MILLSGLLRRLTAKSVAPSVADKVAGVNLPMLVRVLNYPVLDLATLADKALSGGRDGILLCKRPT